MSRPRDAALADLVARALASEPSISAPALRAWMKAAGRSIGLRYAQALLERARGPAARGRPAASEARGARIWLPADLAAELERHALPGEDLAAAAIRVLRGAVAHDWP